MTSWQQWTSKIATRLATQLGTAVDPREIVVPPDQTLGDFCFGVFRLAAERKAQPAELAQQIASAFDLSDSDIMRVTAHGPYVNFTLSIGDVVTRVTHEIETEGMDYGKSKEQRTEEVLLEHANPNTHKEIHIGHTRMLTLGASVLNMLRAYGESVISISYINDVGANVSKTLWHFVQRDGLDIRSLELKNAEKLVQGVKPEDRGGRLLGQIYTDATRLEGENPDVKKEISFVQQQLEAHAPAWEYLWRETQRWCVEELRDICDDLHVQIDRQYFESDFLDRAHEIVDRIKQDGIARESQGAEIVDLEDEKLGVFLLRKSDGTLLYSAKDLALAEQKRADYPDAKKSLYVVDSRQSLYLKQLFMVLRKMGFSQEYVHIAFDIVTLKDGVMSSRKGNIITYQAFRDAVIEEARKGILERHTDWPEEVALRTARVLAMGAIKFTMLKQDSDRKIVFDLTRALSFDGATGPYCQYAVTRLGSILKKADQKKATVPTSEHPSEKALALVLAAFPLRLSEAAETLRPSVMAQWCVDTAQAVSAFYRDVPVLESAPQMREQRLRLTRAAHSTLTRGLHLLGIQVPDEM